VQLEVHSNAEDFDLYKVFQFHIGAIRSFSINACLSAMRVGFNSILVQLEENLCLLFRSGHTLFQFHIGAIRRPVPLFGGQQDLQFQFHIGAIRSYKYQKLAANSGLCFNSILVQLEEAVAAQSSLQAQVSFQFHIGAIRSDVSKVPTQCIC